MSPPLDGAELFRRLDAAGVDYVVVGGFAVIAHGVVRATKDVDVCPAPDRDNLERLATLLRDLNARQIGQDEFDADEFPYDPTEPAELALGGNFLVETDVGRLDIMQWLSGVEDDAYHVLVADAVEAEAFGVRIRVASLTALRRMKAAAGRPQDLEDLRRLAIAHGDDWPATE